MAPLFQLAYLALWYGIVNHIAGIDYIGAVRLDGQPAGPPPLAVVASRHIPARLGFRRCRGTTRPTVIGAGRRAGDAELSGPPPRGDPGDRAYPAGTAGLTICAGRACGQWLL
jgi:hypothetical protein